MRTFTILWFGQLVSTLGSAMTGFAISIWAWQITGQATALALVGFFTFAPAVLLSPLAGALIDRWSRRVVLLLSDLGTCAATVVMLALHLNDALSIGHLYVLGALGGALGAFQAPAYAATISLMLAARHHGRANAMLSLVSASAVVLAPALAGLLLGTLGIAGIFVLDIASFCVAFSTLLVIRIPPPSPSPEGEQARATLWREALYGFAYIRRSAGLRTLLGLFAAINVIGAFGMILLAPMVLARSGGDQVALGTVLSAQGAGGIVGGVLVSAWGGPKRRIHGVLWGMLAVCVVGYGLLGWGSSLLPWAAGAFAITFFLPLLSSSYQAIWQSAVPPDVQGRVFAARQFVSQLAMPIVMLAAGPLADRVFEPALLPGGGLAASVGVWLGTGAGSGMALLFLLAGGIGTLLAVWAFARPSVRGLEEHVAAVASDVSAAAGLASSDTRPVAPDAPLPSSGDA